MVEKCVYLEIFIYFNNQDFLNNVSRILFNKIVIILKKIKNNPNQPTKTAIESKLEPRSRCNKLCIFLFKRYYLTLIIYLIDKKKCQTSDFFNLLG